MATDWHVQRERCGELAVVGGRKMARRCGKRGQREAKGGAAKRVRQRGIMQGNARGWAHKHDLRKLTT